MAKRQGYIKPPEFIVTERDGMPLVYVTGVFGGLAPNDARMLLFTDRLELKPADVPGTQKVERINQEMQVEIHMSPATFKSIATWMMDHIKRYEDAFGEIQMKPEKRPSESGEGYVQ